MICPTAPWGVSLDTIPAVCSVSDSYFKIGDFLGIIIPYLLLFIGCFIVLKFFVESSSKTLRKLCPSDQDRYEAFQKVIEEQRKEHPEWKFNFTMKATGWGTMKYKLEVVKSNGEIETIES